jgi:hydroxymethylglutaryl-CoA lyase
MPQSLRLTDITGRDGFQNVKQAIPTQVKINILSALAEAGVKKMEITSFVSPRAIPQLADAREVIASIGSRYPEVALTVLIPNLKGAGLAEDNRIKEVNYIISASLAHNKANINRTHEQSLDDLAAITAAYPGLKVILSIPTVFGCPFTGEVPLAVTLRLIAQGLERGVSAVTLCDTIGVANPAQVQAVLRAVAGRFPGLDVGLHLHDTHGVGLANTLAGLLCGIDRFEAAGAGLGGCPFAPGAAGNTAMEDLVNMVERMGISTGVDLNKYLRAVQIIRETINPALTSHLALARSYQEFCFFKPEIN